MSRVLYADVIGDPVEHSKSPIIHRFWLEKLGLKGNFRALRLDESGIESYLQDSYADPFWRGCSVTFPLKRVVPRYVSDPVNVRHVLGAVNCVVRSPIGCFLGINTDIDGMDAAFAGVELAGKKICLLGAGGAARAAFCYLSRQQVGAIAVVARRAEQAGALKTMLPQGSSVDFRTFSFDSIDVALDGADVLINATPMGMAGQAEMNSDLLGKIGSALPATVMDMVYAPVETPLLLAARAGGSTTIDGYQMLIGQAAPAFSLFFGSPAPREHDGELKALLAR
jgi:shikimate dehydrogenase